MADRTAEPRRFQTRTGINRRPKEEREQYAREEAARQEQRLTESAQTLSTTARGALSGRGRLTSLPNSTNRIRTENTGGVFGAAAPPLPKTRGGRAGRQSPSTSVSIAQPSQNELLQETSRSAANTKSNELNVAVESMAKAESKSPTKARGSGSKKDDVVDLSSEDEVDEGERRDIEHIWISSDEESSPSRPNQKRSGKGPARHVATLRPLRAPRDSRVEGEALSARNRVLPTLVRNDNNDAGDDGVRATATKDDVTQEPSDKLPHPPVSLDIDRKTSKRKVSRLKDATAITETAEEHAERLRYNEEVRKLVGELEQHKSTSRTDALQSSGAEDNVRDRRLYLFQFPPLTPVLADPAAEIEVKEEPEVDVRPVGSSAPPKSSGTAVKKEDGAEEPRAKSDVLTADNMQLPKGLAGTLRVHKSGKVTMDWGGTDLEVRYGTEVDFLQDVVMTDATEQSAWALGQVEKKMVCIPNWQKLYE